MNFLWRTIVNYGSMPQNYGAVFKGMEIDLL